MASIWQGLEGLADTGSGAAVLLDVEGSNDDMSGAVLEPLLGAPRGGDAPAAGRKQGTRHVRLLAQVTSPLCEPKSKVGAQNFGAKLHF